jgi:GPH family glycoside/pentoside/hexuronide:cation symporter
MNTQEPTESTERSQSQKGRIMFSYGFGKFLFEFSGGAFTALVFIFYETNLHLSTSLTALGFIIYSIWNAINDPLLGYLTQKPTKLSNKYGRRFPWIFIGSLIWGFTLVSIFAVPDSVIADQTLLFSWLVLTTCINHGLRILWEVNNQSIFPDKFEKRRTR